MTLPPSKSAGKSAGRSAGKSAGRSAGKSAGRSAGKSAGRSWLEQSLDFSDKTQPGFGSLRPNIRSAACLNQRKAKIRPIDRTRLQRIDFLFSLLLCVVMLYYFP